MGEKIANYIINNCIHIFLNILIIALGCVSLMFFFFTGKGISAESDTNTYINEDSDFKLVDKDNNGFYIWRLKLNDTMWISNDDGSYLSQMFDSDGDVLVYDDWAYYKYCK